MPIDDAEPIQALRQLEGEEHEVILLRDAQEGDVIALYTNDGELEHLRVDNMAGGIMWGESLDEPGTGVRFDVESGTFGRGEFKEGVALDPRGGLKEGDVVVMPDGREAIATDRVEEPPDDAEIIPLN